MLLRFIEDELHAVQLAGEAGYNYAAARVFIHCFTRTVLDVEFTMRMRSVRFS